MAKRSATTELNHDNWNDEEEHEDAGSFKQASADILQKRVIKTARRKLGANSGEEKPSVFAGFGGFGASTPKPAASLFSFLDKKPSPSAESPKTENGSSNSVTTDENGNEAEYLANLRVLNEAVASWVSEHVKKNPCCLLTPIFQDYEKHLKGLEEKRKSRKSETPITTSTGKETPSSEPVAAKFSFGKALETSSTSTVTPIKTDTTKTEPPKFEFGKVPTSTAPALNFFSSSTSSSSSTPSSTFSFGSNTNATPFTFGSSTAPAAPFSFGFNSMNKPIAPVTEKKEKKEEDDGNEDEDTPPKQEIKKVEEDDAFYSIRCKLFYKKGNSYAEKGVGTLFLKTTGDEKTQLVVRAETSLGNILLNIFLNPQLSTQRVGKNNVMLVCVPNPPIDPKTPSVPTPMLFRVKTEEEADDLLKKLDEAKK